MSDFGLLILRLTVGTFIAGHGSQKLFGWFEGPGLKGTQGFMESLGLRPGKVWGTLAALTEFSGGVFTALGFLNPVGPMSVAAAMTVATHRAHLGKPIWNMKGGAEFPLTNIAAALTLASTGPGRYSLDRALGFRVPRPLAALAWLGTIATTIVALRQPEIADTVLQKATEIVTGSSQSAAESDIVVETRQRAQETADQAAQAAREATSS